MKPYVERSARLLDFMDGEDAEEIFAQTVLQVLLGKKPATAKAVEALAARASAEDGLAELMQILAACALAGVDAPAVAKAALEALASLEKKTLMPETAAIGVALHAFASGAKTVAAAREKRMKREPSLHAGAELEILYLSSDRADGEQIEVTGRALARIIVDRNLDKFAPALVLMAAVHGRREKATAREVLGGRAAELDAAAPLTVAGRKAVVRKSPRTVVVKGAVTGKGEFVPGAHDVPALTADFHASIKPELRFVTTAKYEALVIDGVVEIGEDVTAEDDALDAVRRRFETACEQLATLEELPKARPQFRVKRKA